MNIQSIAVSELSLDPSNVRKHSRRNLDAIKASLRKFGQQKPIVVDAKGIVLAGNGTLTAAQELGWTKIQITRTELAGVEATAFAIADNRTAELAEWDEDGLAKVLESLKVEDADLLAATGYDAAEVDKMVGAEVAEDEVPEPPADPITKAGDLWILGEHRVMCGDSTKAEDVERLMAGGKADMVFTDPPYGIAYSSSKFDGNKAGVTNKRNKAEMIIGDGDDFDPSFLLEMFKSAKEMFVWGYQYYPDKLGRGGIIVWNKKRETQAANPHGDFELCWSRQERNKMCWLEWGGFKNKEKGEDRLHTTQKPVALALWFFENWGNGLVCVVDLFGGSGSTLIACEKTARNCRMMELDPRYCDVIVKRWENLTGKKAVLENRIQ